MPNNDNNCVKEHLKFSVVLSHRTTGYTASTCFSIQSSLPSYPNAKPLIVHRKIWAPWLFLLIYPLITKLWQTLIWLIIEFCFKIVFVKQIYDFQHCIKSSYFVQGNLIQVGSILYFRLQILKPYLPVKLSPPTGLYVLSFKILSLTGCFILNQK